MVGSQSLHCMVRVAFGSHKSNHALSLCATCRRPRINFAYGTMQACVAFHASTKNASNNVQQPIRNASLSWLGWARGSNYSCHYELSMPIFRQTIKIVLRLQRPRHDQKHPLAANLYMSWALCCASQGTRTGPPWGSAHRAPHTGMMSMVRAARAYYRTQSGSPAAPESLARRRPAGPPAAPPCCGSIWAVQSTRCCRVAGRGDGRGSRSRI